MPHGPAVLVPDAPPVSLESGGPCPASPKCGPGGVPLRPDPALAPPGPPPGAGAMAFTFAAFCYMLTLVLCASLIFFVIWHVRLGSDWGRGGGQWAYEAGRGWGGWYQRPRET